MGFFKKKKAEPQIDECVENEAVVDQDGPIVLSEPYKLGPGDTVELYDPNIHGDFDASNYLIAADEGLPQDNPNDYTPGQTLCFHAQSNTVYKYMGMNPSGELLWEQTEGPRFVTDEKDVVKWVIRNPKKENEEKIAKLRAKKLEAYEPPPGLSFESLIHNLQEQEQAEGDSSAEDVVEDDTPEI